MSREEDAEELAAAYPDFDPRLVYGRSELFTEIEPGLFRSDLPDHLREGLPHLLQDLRDLLLADDADTLRRLYPTAYPDDERRNDEFVRFAHDQLLEARLAGLDEVEASIDSDTVSAEQLHAWMQALNSLRLVLGTRLDVSEDDPRELDDDDPAVELFAIYRLLGALVGAITDALVGTLPELEG